MVQTRAREDFGRVVSRAGFTRPQLATAAGVSVRTIDAMANPVAAGRSGIARQVTAWRIAKGFAALTGKTEDEAFALLFVEEEIDLGNSAPVRLAA